MSGVVTGGNLFVGIEDKIGFFIFYLFFNSNCKTRIHFINSVIKSN